VTLARDGWEILRNRSIDVADPWAFVHGLIGARPEMVEVQPIRPRPDGRSFASTTGFTPLHTDSQDYRGVSPALQIMVCKRAAASGGETRLVDGRALIDAIANRDPQLHTALVTTPRRHRFYFGDVISPTMSDKAGHRRVITHSPLAPADPVGESFAHELSSAPTIELPVATGEILLVDNHRMLHGRNAFLDDQREFVRLLAWIHPRERMSTSESRLAVVLELLTGTPPARLAAREGISEAELYAWRTRALTAAGSALELRE
jgi:hypothetical protein